MKLFVLLMLSLNLFANAPGKPEAQALKKEAITLWENRDIQDQLENLLSKLEVAHEADKTDREILEMLSQGYFILADQHLTNDDLKKRAYEKGRAWGLKGMELNKAFAEKIKSKSIQKSADALTEEDVPSIFWMLANTGKWSKLNGIFSSLKYKDEILSLLTRVEALRPKFYYSAVPRYWGGFYALAPGIAGGDMNKSKKKFHEAMESSPEYLGTKVLYAEIYLVKKEDKAGFEKVLKEVIAAGPGPVEIQPENRMEKRKAQKLLEKMNEIF